MSYIKQIKKKYIMESGSGREKEISKFKIERRGMEKGCIGK